MFALARSSSSRAALRSVLPRAVVVGSPTPATAGKSVSLTIGDKLHAKEKTEEDRFIREKEKAYFEKKKAALEAQMHDKELKEFKDAVAPLMAEACVILKKTGEHLSDEALEALARWKLGN